jgi:hypothetical protein
MSDLTTKNRTTAAVSCTADATVLLLRVEYFRQFLPDLMVQSAFEELTPNVRVTSEVAWFAGDNSATLRLRSSDGDLHEINDPIAHEVEQRRYAHYSGFVQNIRARIVAKSAAAAHARDEAVAL